MRSASRWGPRSPGSTTRSKPCGLPSRPTSGHPTSRRGASHDDHRPTCRRAHPQLAHRDCPSPPPRPGPYRYVRAHASDGPGVERADERSRVTRPLPIVFAAGAIAVVVVLVNIELGSLGGGANRPLGVQYGTTAQISGQWVSANSEAFSVQFQTPEDESLYWRAAVYDTFDLTAWKQTVAAGYDVAIGDEVLGASADKVAEAGRRAVTFRVFPTDYRASMIVSPQSPSKVDTPVRVSYVGDGRDSSPASTARRAIPIRSPRSSASAATTRMGRSRSTVFARPGRRTQRRSASTISRCPTVPSRRAATRSSSSTTSLRMSRTRPTRTTSRARWSTTSSRRPTSSTTLTSATSPARACRRSNVSPGSAAATASTTRRPWRSCSASTASRRVWLPGSCQANAMRDSSSRVSVSAAHAWVEVYFPEYGWVEFDPTGGGLAATVPLPTGEPAP